MLQFTLVTLLAVHIFFLMTSEQFGISLPGGMQMQTGEKRHLPAWDGDFLNPCSRIKVSFDPIFRHLALSLWLQNKGRHPKSVQYTKTNFPGVKMSNCFLGTLKQSLVLLQWNLISLLEIIKIMDFPVYRFVCKFLKVFRINGSNKNGPGEVGDHTNHTKIKVSLKTDKYRNTFHK